MLRQIIKQEQSRAERTSVEGHLIAFCCRITQPQESWLRQKRERERQEEDKEGRNFYIDKYEYEHEYEYDEYGYEYHREYRVLV